MDKMRRILSSLVGARSGRRGVTEEIFIRDGEALSEKTSLLTRISGEQLVPVRICTCTHKVLPVQYSSRPMKSE